jgi:hypothetical protein
LAAWVCLIEGTLVLHIVVVGGMETGVLRVECLAVWLMIWLGIDIGNTRMSNSKRPK